jgi:glutamine synthetase type III
MSEPRRDAITVVFDGSFYNDEWRVMAEKGDGIR